MTFGVNANILSLRWGCWLKSGNVIQFAELEDKGLHAPSCKCVARQRLTQVRLNLANRVVIPIPVQSKAGSRGVSMVFAAVSQQIYRRVDEWSSRLAHNQEIVGSNPTPATIYLRALA